MFGTCGGCQYQELTYDEALKLKEQGLRDLLKKNSFETEGCLENIIPSPQIYHYRSRLDLRLARTRQSLLMGFSPQDGRRVVVAEHCPIAMPAISDFFPELKQEAVAKLPAKYRNANLVVKAGDDGRVVWGGIGRKSLRLAETDYLWTTVMGKKIFYSLDTFFQANLSILPRLVERIIDLKVFNPNASFYDLYGGVGLFGICFYDLVRNVVLIEENIHAVAMSRYNSGYHQMERFETIAGKVEEQFLPYLESSGDENAIAMIDPPRSGLAAGTIDAQAKIKNLLYLSCKPEALVRDLSLLVKSGWHIKKVVPFDFFPRTRHLETLAFLGH
jgi:23S rRNA (uracil1939-C5)-methyltransferase/tRNA (uracil-5-)-methyltransferase